jgi:hypothetical protein
MRAKTLKERFKLAPRQKWFAHTSKDAECDWVGPSDTIGDAVLMADSWFEHRNESVFVAQGRKLNKREIEEMGVDYDWEVDSAEAFEVVMPGKAES